MKRLTIFILLISSIVCCLCINEMQAQEKLFPLKHNPVYDLEANKAEKGFRKSYDKLCLNPISLSVANTQKPNSCGVPDTLIELGSISINVSGGEPNYEIYLNNVLQDITSTNTFVFEDLVAGAYFIKVIDAIGDVIEIGVPLDELYSNAFIKTDLDIGTIGCTNNQGLVKYRPGSTTDRIYEIYNAETDNLVGLVDFGQQELFLNAGTYYANIESNVPFENDTIPCRSFHIFDMEYE